MKVLRFCFDIDGTICNNTDGHYELAEPMKDRIEKINQLFDGGHHITYYTARGMNRFNGNVKLVNEKFYDFTEHQLEQWGCKYHALLLGKPSYDLMVDDKAMMDSVYFDDSCCGIKENKMKQKPEEHLKGWGKELWHCNTVKYCGKSLFFSKGKRCSFHFHKLKDETFALHSGRLIVRYGWDEDIMKATVVILEPGDTFYVPPGLIHQMEAIEDSELLEFSTTHFESDSYRIIKRRLK